MKVYVNWYSQEILTKDEFHSLIVETMEDNNNFSEYLEYKYSTIEIFEMNRERRPTLLEDFTKWAMEHTILGDYEEVELDVEPSTDAIVIISTK